MLPVGRDQFILVAMSSAPHTPPIHCQEADLNRSPYWAGCAHGCKCSLDRGRCPRYSRWLQDSLSQPPGDTAIAAIGDPATWPGLCPPLRHHHLSLPHSLPPGWLLFLQPKPKLQYASGPLLCSLLPPIFPQMSRVCSLT